MSCDWNVKCLDCNEITDFSDANHATDLMLSLIKNAKGLAVVHDVISMICAETSYAYYEGMRISSHRIPTEFFAKHHDHKMVPINEYGECLDECAERYKCACCETTLKCCLPTGHEGAHSKVRP